MKVVCATLAALLVTLAGTACGEDEVSSADPSSLEGIPWVLASGVDVEGWEDVAPTATFNGARVAGSTGCNRFTASYTVDGEALDIGPIASTMRACVPPADTVEREYVAALERVSAWRLEDDELALLGADEEELLRYRAATPVGSWEATGILSGDAVTTPIAGTKITASFDEDGKISGSAGCNTYNAAYTTDRGTIEIEPPAATKKACSSPEGVMEQETAYLEALPTAARYEVEGRSLGLLTAEGTIVASYMQAP